ncbi:MAG: 3-deoxy-8-phosphooctulonate synthase, partial [Planctomycetes bacterium]|nr:3-deoxy-8-phosphooctulonate synthase [Planctomycetota bacterium]
MSQFAPETPLVQSGSLAIGAKSAPVIIAGPDSLESEELALTMATELVLLQDKLQVPFVFKGSYDKANRSSIDSFRGLGIDEGLDVLAEIRRDLNLPVLTDVHTQEQA